MGDQRIVTSAKIDEPVPLASSQQHGYGMEGAGQHGGASVRDQIGLLHNPHIADLGERRLAGDELRQPPALAGAGLKVQVQEVVVGRVVERPDHSLQLAHVPSQRRYEVGEARRVPVRRPGGGAGGRREGGEVRREEEDGEDGGGDDEGDHESFDTHDVA